MPRSRSPVRSSACRLVLRASPRSRSAALVASLAVLCVATGAAGQGAALRFAADGVLQRELDLAALRAVCPTHEVAVEDPYYGRSMRFRALVLVCVLEAGFAVGVEELARDDFSLIALDGYSRPTTGAQLAAPGGHLAWADAALTDADASGPGPRFAPIDRRQVDPAPFYMIWEGAERSDPHRYPWPYQLATIERVPFERRHPHTVPRISAPGSPARAGFAIFRRECIMCHSINDEGGKVGPELNIPRSIVEYRPIAQIQAFVRNPAQFRYSSMPAHEHLSQADLDALVAYFQVMSELKHDPRRNPPSSPGEDADEAASRH